MLDLNAPAPDFALQGVLDGAVRTWRLPSAWTVLVFYPADFSFVCPTEIRGFHARRADFPAEILAIGTDDIETHRAWVKELGGVSYPILSDPGGSTAKAYGAFNDESGRAFRSTFIVQPDRRIAYAVASPVNVGRSVEETLRVLRALQTGRMCPVDWKP